MFSLKAFILYILFFVIGWLIARWLWNKKLSEAREASSYPLSVSSRTMPETSSDTAAATTASASADTAPQQDDKTTAAKDSPSEVAKTTPSASPATKPVSSKRSAKVTDDGTSEAAKATTASKPEKTSKPAKAKPAKPAKKAESNKPERLKGPRDGEADDLKKIKGVGKKIEEKLNGFGIYHFDQIGNWTDDQVKWIGGELAFAGRIERENWIEQAKVLASGGDTEFSRRVEKGKVSSSKA
ncbi:MAG: hypothetical protein ABJO09_15755 [Hyphomicrobiales bacterium]